MTLTFPVLNNINVDIDLVFFDFKEFKNEFLSAFLIYMSEKLQTKINNKTQNLLNEYQGFDGILLNSPENEQILKDFDKKRTNLINEYLGIIQQEKAHIKTYSPNTQEYKASQNNIQLHEAECFALNYAFGCACYNEERYELRCKSDNELKQNQLQK